MVSGAMPALRNVYEKFGEVSEAAQLLETESGNILILVDAVDSGFLENPDPEQASSIFQNINLRTLGQLLNKLDKSGIEASDLEEILNKALEERNRLVHSFFRQHNFRRNSAAGCSVMLNDLQDIHEALLKAYKEVMLLSGTDLDRTSIDTLPSTHLPLK